MTRGTTPVLVFRLNESVPFDTLYVTFEQDDTIVLEKTLEDVHIEENSIYLSLSQADTLAFDSRKILKVQLRGKVGEKAYASGIKRLDVQSIIKDGEI